jgi:hypothetical protein
MDAPGRLGSWAGPSASQAKVMQASSSSVVQQARLMATAGTAWHAVKCGNLEVCACACACRVSQGRVQWDGNALARM